MNRFPTEICKINDNLDMLTRKLRMRREIRGTTKWTRIAQDRAQWMV
jgi:hypothetical protein